MARVRITDPICIRILYESANTCCVCQRPTRPVQIHHIDGNHSNSIQSNLVALCSLCHDKAHTKHERSQNLTPKRILAFKKAWNTQVAERAVNSMLPTKGLDGTLWTYIQHNRLFEIMERVSVRFDERLFRELRLRHIIDRFGVPQRLVVPSPNSHTWTVYDYLEYNARHQVHHLLAKAIDGIIQKTCPIDVDAIWRRRDLDALLNPGTVCYSQRAFYFKRRHENSTERVEDRFVFARARRIRLEMHISTRDMFGESSVITNFCGHKTAACLFVAKSVTREKSWLVIHGTPIAMGTGSTARGTSPYTANDRPQSWQAFTQRYYAEDDA